jgi:hypothetical protein
MNSAAYCFSRPDSLPTGDSSPRPWVVTTAAGPSPGRERSRGFHFKPGRVVMPELIHRHAERVKDSSGVVYQVLIYGEPRDDGTWEG